LLADAVNQLSPPAGTTARVERETEAPPEAGFNPLPPHR